MAVQGRCLILVRHSLPEIAPSVQASQWHLSEEGRRRCEKLAERLAAYEPHLIITSLEPKAIETGEIVARILGIPCETAPNLHEHERPKEEHFGTREEFEAQVSGLFERPGELVFGSETADEAHDRFSSAVEKVLEMHRSGTVAIVAHGTVLTLFVARAAGVEPISFWKRLGLPAFVVLSLPELAVEAIEHISSQP